MIHRYLLHLSAIVILSLACAAPLCAQNPTWEVMVTRTDGIPPTSMQISSSGRIFICPMGFVECSDDQGVTWRTCAEGLDAFQVTSLVKGLENELFAISTTGIYRSTDDGEHWSRFAPSIESAYQFFVARNGDVYISTGGPGAMISTDHGATWKTELNGVIPGSFAEDNAGRILAGLLDSGIYRSEDRGATWTPTSLAAGYVDAIIATKTGAVLAGIIVPEGNGRVYRTNDGGGSWSSTTLHDRVLGIVALPDGSVASNTANTGVVLSTDDGRTWKGINSGLLDTRIFALAVHPSGRLFACDPFGRIYRTTAPVASSADEASATTSVRFAPNPTSTDGTFSLTLASGGHVRLTLADASGAILRTLVDGELPAGDHRIMFDAKGLPSGTYFYRLMHGSTSSYGSIVILH